jgi:phospholipid-transporting ATPase
VYTHACIGDARGYFQYKTDTIAVLLPYTHACLLRVWHACRLPRVRVSAVLFPVCVRYPGKMRFEASASRDRDSASSASGNDSLNGTTVGVGGGAGAFTPAAAAAAAASTASSATQPWWRRAAAGLVQFLKDPDLRPLFERQRSTEPRVVRLNNPTFNAKQRFMSNYISTTQYELWTFVPVFLVRQLLRPANFYFLIVGILYLISSITPVFTAGRYATLAALAFLIFITAVKELAEDLKRYREDRRVNATLVEVLNSGNAASDAESHVKAWRDVQVGDLVVVRRDEGVPADLIALSSSTPDGTCFVETRAIDGETNLKVKSCIPLNRDLFTPKQLRTLIGEFHCEAPNPRLYEFEGRARIEVPDETGLPTGEVVECAVSRDHLLQRGIVLRNTDWVIGIAVYTGKETKLMMNLKREAHKVGRIEKTITRFILALICIQFFIALILTILNGVWAHRHLHPSQTWYLDERYSVGNVVLRFFTFFLTISNFVPISLYVTMEIVRGLQSIFIVVDDHMYCWETRTRARCRNSTLNDELGQITHVFTDKTGTMTQNIMEFAKAYVDGEEITQRRRDHENDLEFFRLLALCNTVAPSRDDTTGQIEYHAPSPDERALVIAAHYSGVTLYDRNALSMILLEDEQPVTYAVLHVLEFTSERKRMSIVVRKPDGRIRLYTKGADSVMCARARSTDTKAEQALAGIQQAVHRFALAGLRTLVVGYRDLDEDLYAEWAKRYTEASSSMENRASQVEALADEIERDLTLLGVSAIIDYLQRDVPDTLRSLYFAGIKVWMLTGDKQETAINVGLSSGLLGRNMDIVVLSPGDAADIDAQLDCAEARWRALEVDGVSAIAKALVVGGDVLDVALQGSLRRKLVRVSEYARCVIACRMTPKQKAELVRCMRENNPHATTLAIGDGANDVGMIQVAHVGVGIAGREGMEAALASDFSIGEFRFLKRLVLVHGRWFYKRNSKLVVYMIYKNAALASFEIWFATKSAFSGAQFFNPWLGAMYNVFLTSIPVIVLATLDQEVSAAYTLFYPEIYRSGQRNTSGRWRVFAYWFFTALCQSVVMFYLTFYARADGPGNGGQMLGKSIFEMTCFTELVVVVHLQLALYQARWTLFSFCLYFFSATLWFWLGPAFCARTFTVDLDLAAMLYWNAMRIFSEPLLWLIIILCVIICETPPLLIHHWNRMYFPSPKVIVQELEWFGVLHRKRTPHPTQAYDVEPKFVQLTRRAANQREYEAVPMTYSGDTFTHESLPGGGMPWNRSPRSLGAGARSHAPSSGHVSRLSDVDLTIRERSRRRFYSTDVSAVNLRTQRTGRAQSLMGAQFDNHLGLSGNNLLNAGASLVDARTQSTLREAPQQQQHPFFAENIIREDNDDGDDDVDDDDDDDAGGVHAPPTTL